VVERKTDISNTSSEDWLRIVLESALAKGFVDGGAIFFRLIVFGDFKGFQMAGAGKCSEMTAVGLGEAQAPD
jgi:hypothetical protein